MSIPEPNAQARVDHLRAVLAGEDDHDDQPVTVVCDVCEREIPYTTARVIPAIGYMCPEGVEPKCEPQRSIWDVVADLNQQAHDALVEAVENMIAVATSEASGCNLDEMDPEANDVFHKWAEIIVKSVKNERK